MFILVNQEAVDLLAVRDGNGGVIACSRNGRAEIMVRDGMMHYHPIDGDPFGYEPLVPWMTMDESLEATFDTDYPDAPYQLLTLMQSPRCGDIVVSARKGYDLRKLYEHPEHHASHGSLHRDHMHVPLMINEEDHLRIQVMHSGLALKQAWEQVDRIDNAIEEKVVYAFHQRLGYLTACPTNVGTGMRVSVMLHLPALVMVRQIDRLFRSLQKINLAVRGLYGEGSAAMGDFYQISNQITLGRNEDDLMEQVSQVIPAIIEYERRSREALVQDSERDLHDRVSRAYCVLCTAQTISSEETMHLLSSIRMGVELRLLPELAMGQVNELFIQTQPAHLQKISGKVLDTADRNIARATFLRQHLGRDDTRGQHEAN